MPRPIRRVGDLLRELARYRENSYIKIKTKDGVQYNIKNVKKVGSTIQILI